MRSTNAMMICIENSVRITTNMLICDARATTNIAIMQRFEAARKNNYYIEMRMCAVHLTNAIMICIMPIVCAQLTRLPMRAQQLLTFDQRFQAACVKTIIH